MMNKLIHGIDELVDSELALANRDNGSVFHSGHEAWAVMLEEVEEADEAMMAVRDRSKRINELQDRIAYAAGRMEKAAADHKRVWKHQVRNNRLIQEKDFEALEEYALDAAAELIQVAAMCRKWKQSQEAWRKEVEAKLP